MIELPQWIEDVLRVNGDSYTPLTLSGSPDHCILSRNGTPVDEFTSVHDAYAYATDKNEDIDLINLDENLCDQLHAFSVNDMSHFCTIRHTKSYLLLKYGLWSQWVGSYHENPESFWESHHFLCDHPAFWRFDEQAHEWDTSYTPDLEPYDSGDSKVIWGIESGAAVKGTMMRYHDIEMDAYGDSAEEAVIELARNLSRLYDDDGERRK